MRMSLIGILNFLPSPCTVARREIGKGQGVVGKPPVLRSLRYSSMPESWSSALLPGSLVRHSDTK